LIVGQVASTRLGIQKPDQVLGSAAPFRCRTQNPTHPGASPRTQHPGPDPVIKDVPQVKGLVLDPALDQAGAQ
jgi:hypothetical protein